MEAIIIFLMIIISILLISKGSDWLTDSLIPIARKLKTSNVSVALILVSVVVSLPEILVAADTAFRGYKEISLGVVFGSIMCNIGLMTGLSAIIRPLTVSHHMILRDGVFSIVVPILIFAISSQGDITRLQGLAIFLLFIPYLTNVFLQEKQTEYMESALKRDIEIELEMIGIDFGHIKAGWVSFVLGLGLLLYGTYLFSNLLIQIVELFSFDPTFIGMTLGAIVPSLPNIAASYKATKKGLTEIAVSETIGSNVFTLLVTIGIVSMISPISIQSTWLNFDIPVMLWMSLLLFIFMSTGRGISRSEGLVLFSSYIGVLLIQTLVFIR